MDLAKIYTILLLLLIIVIKLLYKCMVLHEQNRNVKIWLNMLNKEGENDNQYYAMLWLSNNGQNCSTKKLLCTAREKK